jgi:predicted ATPase
MTRLRLDEPTFEAVRNAIVNNPKARCKAEVHLPAAYPRIESTSFTGGFLDGVHVDLSPNLNAFIGGRGSGKSTALIAIRAALGATLHPEEDPDEAGRMPDSTKVVFTDRTGARRTAVRKRGEEPHDPTTGGLVALDLADMGQGATGRLARGYSAEPSALRSFLDAFVDLAAHRERQEELTAQLADNAAAIQRDRRGLDEMEAAKKEVKRLEDSLTAAQSGNLEDLARYAMQLTAERALLAELDELTAQLLTIGVQPVEVDLPAMAAGVGVDPARQPAKDFMGPAEGGVESLLKALATRRSELAANATQELAASSATLLARVQAWKEKHAAWQEKMDQRQRELDEQGLQVQAGEIVRVANALETARAKLTDLETRSNQVQEAEAERKTLLASLNSDRDAEHNRRKATLRRVVAEVNDQAEGLRIHISIGQNRDDRTWCDWLTAKLSFRQPRVSRIAREVSPQEFADALRGGQPKLAALRAEGEVVLNAEQLDAALELRKWAVIFELETMRRDDRVRIEVSEPGATDRRPFDHLSAGQQRSVLLSLLLSAGRDQPLVVDQPEDHLDAAYIANSVVRQLEGAKERRQVIIATHSPNLTVLGDAELVIPMYASGGHGAPQDPGAVDRPTTREHVCTLLEGGREAYRRRGERYGFEVRLVVR